jgi:predicted kinase
MHLIVLRGLPGSGKSTFAEELTVLLQENRIDSIIISNDSLRKQDSNYVYDVGNNNKIYHENHKLLIDSLKSKVNVIIIDNCNINFDILTNYKKLTSKYNYKYYQLAFEKPKYQDIHIEFRKCQKAISIGTYVNLWKKYTNDCNDIKNFNLEDIFAIIN